MPPPPNEVYTAFSFIGFVLCAIPLYWHLEGTWKYSRVWNTHFKIVPRSLEYGHMLVHDLGWSWMPFAMHQFDRMEQKHD
jgi:hypothetical protein